MPATPLHRFGGQETPSTGEDVIEVLDPSTGELLGIVPAGTAADAAAAAEAAAKAAPAWARQPAAERGAALKAGARLLHEHLDELAELVMRENGKPLADARGGVEAGISTIEQYAELGPLHRGRSLLGSFGATDVMVPEPYGVAALLVPWNDPIAIACGLIGAALGTGNTVVFKPSEKTPLSAVRLVELLERELPAGALNLLLGDVRAGRPLVASPVVKVVAHVGSMATGREIAEVCGSQLKKALVELGGKDPLIVDEGVDPEWAAGQAALGAFANAGQICTSVERIYVHAAVADAFTAALVRRAGELRVGPGSDPKTEMGPLVDARQRDLVHAHVQDAVDAGATLLSGGVIPPGPGFFYPPTVLTGCTDDMLVLREETFGPVAPVRVVGSFDEAIEAANRTSYGLAATVLTSSAANAQRAWRELEVGTVKINAVFGGAPGGAAEPHRSSGLGFGYGPELLDELTTTKVVHWDTAAGG